MFEIEFRPDSGIGFGRSYWLDGDFGEWIEYLRWVFWGEWSGGGGVG